MCAQLPDSLRSRGTEFDRAQSGTSIFAAPTSLSGEGLRALGALLDFAERVGPPRRAAGVRQVRARHVIGLINPERSD